MTLFDRVADYSLQIAFDANVIGAFYIETSLLDGPDILTDDPFFPFSGTFDDVTDDIVDTVTVVNGTDSLAGAVQAGNLTVDLLDTDDLAKYNPNNAGSSLNASSPGFVPMRPVQLIATQDGVDEGIFWGFLRRADWKSDTCACELYCEDLLMFADRVFPTIMSTGPTTTGAAIGLLLDYMGWTNPVYRSLSTGDNIPDFSGDGTKSVLALIQDLLTAERGTVYVRGDGVVVYESRDLVQIRDSSWTLDDELTDQDSSVDLDAIFTRASVTPSTGITSTYVSATAETVYGRADMQEVQTDYLTSDSVALALATDIVYEASTGKPPITVDVDNDTPETLQKVLASPLLSVFTMNETLGDTTGDFIVQRITHTIRAQSHQTEYLLTKRIAKAFDIVTSAIDGSDSLRY